MGFKFSLQCCCKQNNLNNLGNKIGFANNGGFYPFTCVPNGGLITTLDANISRINECFLVHTGTPYNNCAYALFSPSNETAVADWIHAGGRLVVGAEWSASSFSFTCIDNTQAAQFNSFLSGIGSSITLVNTDTFDGTGGYTAVNGSAKFMSGQRMDGNAAREVSGGVSVASTPGSVSNNPNTIFAAVEQMSAGFVLVIADSNVWLPAGPGDSCPWLTAYATNDSSNVA